MKIAIPISLIKIAFFCFGVAVAIGNFLPHTAIWGFDYYVLRLPYGAKSVPGFLVIVILSAYPFIAGRKRSVDAICSVLALFALSFLILRIYFIFMDVVAGISSEASYRQLTGLDIYPSSIFFSLPTRGFFLTVMTIQVYWILHLASLTRKEMLYATFSCLAAVVLTVAFLVPQ